MPMNAINLRRLTPDDIPLLADWMVTVPLWQRYNLRVDQAAAQFETALRRGDILQVADLPEAPACGFAWGMIGGAFGRSVYLRLIGVRPDLAGHGVGAALLDNLEQIAAGVSSDLFLLVSDFNSDAQRFYRRQGYEHIGSIPAYVLPDVNELIFWKRLR